MMPQKTDSVQAPRRLGDIKVRLCEEMPYLKRRYGVRRLGIFGSYVRGEETLESDLDLLVTFTKKPDLFDYIGLQHHLEDTLGLSVDLGMPGELKAFARETVQKEVQYL